MSGDDGKSAAYIMYSLGWNAKQTG